MITVDYYLKGALLKQTEDKKLQQEALKKKRVADFTYKSSPLIRTGDGGLLVEISSHIIPQEFEVATKTIEGFVARAARFYEQEPGEAFASSRLGKCVQRWMTEVCFTPLPHC